MKVCITYEETVKVQHEVIVEGEESEIDAAIEAVDESSRDMDAVCEVLKRHLAIIERSDEVCEESDGIEYFDSNEVEADQEGEAI